MTDLDPRLQRLALISQIGAQQDAADAASTAHMFDAVKAMYGIQQQQAMGPDQLAHLRATVDSQQLENADRRNSAATRLQGAQLDVQGKAQANQKSAFDLDHMPEQYNLGTRKTEAEIGHATAATRYSNAMADTLPNRFAAKKERVDAGAARQMEARMKLLFASQQLERPGSEDFVMGRTDTIPKPAAPPIYGVDPRTVWQNPSLSGVPGKFHNDPEVRKAAMDAAAAQLTNSPDAAERQKVLNDLYDLSHPLRKRLREMDLPAGEHYYP